MKHLHASTVDPHALVAALGTIGYRVAYERTGACGYVRLARPGEEPPRGSLVIPVDRAAGDYLDLMAAVIADLEDVAQRGEDSTAVLAILAGEQPPALDEPDPLDHAMWTVALEGNWTWVTKQMGTEEREAAVAACMRYDAWFQRTNHDGPPSPRSHFAWWEREL